MAKTYIPQGVDLVTHLNKYLSRRQATMVQGATPGQVTALANLITCLAAFLVEWHKPAVGP